MQLWTGPTLPPSSHVRGFLVVRRMTKKGTSRSFVPSHHVLPGHAVEIFAAPPVLVLLGRLVAEFSLGAAAHQAAAAGVDHHTWAATDSEIHTKSLTYAHVLYIQAYDSYTWDVAVIVRCRSYRVVLKFSCTFNWCRLVRPSRKMFNAAHSVGVQYACPRLGGAEVLRGDGVGRHQLWELRGIRAFLGHFQWVVKANFVESGHEAFV